MVIISRADAKAQGLKRYFDGSACLRGHVAERGTSNAQCLECSRERDRKVKAAMRAEDPEGANANKRAWRAAKPDQYRAAQNSLRAKDPQRYRDINKRTRDKDPDRNREWKRRDQEKNSETYRAWRLKAEYGLPVEVYDHAIIRQLNLCAICGEPETTMEKTGRVRRLAVDHCHDTGNVRGFLCGKCNKAIGLMCDSPDNLRAAADYLDAHNTHTRYSAQIAKRLMIPVPD